MSRRGRSDARHSNPKGSTWDSTDPDNPQPLIYPICSECKEAYVYQRCLSFTTGGYVWGWIKPEKVPKGCRHKAPAEIHEPERGGREQPMKPNE